MSAKNSNLKTAITALVLCLVCSVAVSAVAVGLKPKQLANQALDRNKNILMAADLATPDTSADQVAQDFADFEVKIVNLATGQFASDDELSQAGIDIKSYDPIAAAKDPHMGIALSDDPAGIGAMPKYGKVYIKEDAQGNIELIVLPVHGYGLWGTIYGFLTLESDLNTIKGISFYSHKETPGLGALIEEPKWRALWQGKEAYDETGQVVTGVVKAGTPKPTPHYVDGISGATLTSRGVNNFIRFWLSEAGYKPFLDNLKQGATNG